MRIARTQISYSSFDREPLEPLVVNAQYSPCGLMLEKIYTYSIEISLVPKWYSHISFLWFVIYIPKSHSFDVINRGIVPSNCILIILDIKLINDFKYVCLNRLYHIICNQYHYAHYSHNRYILTWLMNTPPYRFSTLGIILIVSFRATAVPNFKYSKGYSNFWISNENGSILWRYTAFITFSWTTIKQIMWLKRAEYGHFYIFYWYILIFCLILIYRKIWLELYLLILHY